MCVCVRACVRACGGGGGCVGVGMYVCACGVRRSGGRVWGVIN